MISSITKAGIEQTIHNLNYQNIRSPKSRLVFALKSFYETEDAVDTLTEIDSDILIKLIWDTGDDPKKIASKRKNLSSIRTAINSDLKKLYNDDRNPEGIVIGPLNTFVMSDDVKEKLLSTFTSAAKIQNDIPIDKIAEVLSIISEFMTDIDKLSTEKSGEDIKKILDLVKNLSDKIGIPDNIKDFELIKKDEIPQGDNTTGGADEISNENLEERGAIDDIEEVDEDEILEVDEDDIEEVDEEDIIEVDEDEIVETDEDDIEEVDEDDVEEEADELEEIDTDDIEEVEDEDIEEMDEDEIVETDEDDIEEVNEDDVEEEADELEEIDEDDIEEVEDEDIEEVEEDNLEEVDEDDIEEVDGDGIEDAPEDAEEDGDPGELEEIDEDDIEEVDEDDIEEVEDDDLEEVDEDDVEEVDEDSIEDVPEDAEEDGDPGELEEIDEDDIEEVDEDDIEEVEDDDLEEVDEDDIEEVDEDGIEDAPEDAEEDGDPGELEEIDEDDIEEIDEDDIEEVEEEESVGLSLDNVDRKGLETDKNLLAEQFDGYLGTMERFFNQYLIIPAGKYIVGSKKPGKNDLPVKEINMPELYIGKFPVTNAIFEVFVERCGYKTTAEKIGYGWVYTGRFQKIRDSKTNTAISVWNNTFSKKKVLGAFWYQPFGPGSTLHNKRNHPVVQVSVEDAIAFSAWTGKRLPTEFEWEAAARTQNGNRYPWGNTWFDENCNHENNSISDTTPVDNYPDAENSYGIADLLGNVLEWTSEETVPSFGKIRKSKFHIVKGGSWISDSNIRLNNRFRFETGFTSNILGFRCMAD